MVLEGTVSNVAQFGAFVDLGVHQDGLVHVSQLAHKFVNDAREVVKTGDIVKVKVIEVDVARKRIGADDEARRRAGARATARATTASKGAGARPAGPAPRQRAAAGRPDGRRPSPSCKACASKRAWRRRTILASGCGMKALRIYAGPAAREHIAAHGLRPQDVRTIPGAAGGPKGLVLGPLDRFLFGDWLPQPTQPIDLVGASIGAWRLANACLDDARTGLRAVRARLHPPALRACRRARSA